VVIQIAQLEIEPAGQRELWRLLQSSLHDRFGFRDIVVSAGEVTLDGHPRAWTLTEVGARLERKQLNTGAVAQFRVAGLDMPQPATVQLVRQRNADSAATTVRLETGSSSLPCALFSGVVPDVARLGPAASFSGSLMAKESAGGWHATLSGDLHDLDLYSLVTAHYPHRLNGPARVTIEEARFDEGRLQAASGQLIAGPGVVSRSFLDAADAWLGTPTPTHAADADALVLYEQLAVRFDIDEAGLRLSGGCGTAGSGRIMVNRSGTLLSDSPIQPVPVVALVRTLVPENTVQVPATRETEPLVGWLPVPHIQRSRPPAAGEQPPGARLLRSPR
jgi:hypothetical protein